MTDGALVDNDILLKVCGYDIVDEALGILAIFGESVGCLGVAPYVLADRLKKTNRIKDREKAALNLAGFFSNVELLEPNEQEIQTASEFEAAALAAGVNFDVGESLLAAIFIHRNFSCFATGDKRAILASFKLPDLHKALSGHYLCLEQLLKAILNEINFAEVRDKVCSEELIDRASTICFSCSSDNVALDSLFQGLNSYISNLNGQISGALVDCQLLKKTA